MLIPIDARRQLTELRGGEASEAEFLDLMWHRRYPSPPAASSKTGWPFVALVHQVEAPQTNVTNVTNVTKITKRARS